MIIHIGIKVNPCSQKGLQISVSDTISKPQDMGLEFSKCSEIWRSAAEQYDHFNIQSCGFQTSRDMTKEPGIILTKFALRTAPEVLILTSSDAANNDEFLQRDIFLQWISAS